jgi:hypothetical protein
MTGDGTKNDSRGERTEISFRVDFLISLTRMEKDLDWMPNRHAF